jgi:hypothetical protein
MNEKINDAFISMPLEQPLRGRKNQRLKNRGASFAKALLLLLFVMPPLSADETADSKVSQRDSTQRAVSQPCMPPAPDEWMPVGTNARGEPVFERKNSAMQRHCRSLRQKTIERILGDRIDFCQSAGEKVKLRDRLASKMQLIQGREDEEVGGRFLFTHGCKPHDCGVKAFVFMDRLGTHGVVGLLDCERASEKARVRQTLYPRTLYIFSDFASASDIPESIRQRIDQWRQWVEDGERRWFPHARIKEEFLRSPE